MLAKLIIYLLGHLFVGFISTIKGFLKPWQLENYSLGKAIGSFFAAYTASVLVFSLWFYACYLEDVSFFHIGHIESVNWWSFVYFSFVTITTLGYGDITPAHPFSQILVILETMVGVGLVAGFLALIISVAGRSKRKIEKIDFDSDIDY